MSLAETYYLSSLDSARFEPVRTCTVRTRVVLESGKPALVVDLEPHIQGQGLDRSGDISTVVLVARFEGSSVSPIDEFPCFVYITTSCTDSSGRLDTMASMQQLQVIGWGELYRTAVDARDHRFG